MRSMLVVRAVVLIAGLVLVAGLWTTYDTLFFGPIESAKLQISTLHTQLSELAVRQSRASADLDSIPTGQTATPAALVSNAASASISSEAFQEAIRGAIAKVHGTGISSQATTQKLTGGIAKISVLVRARFDELGLLRFMRATESAMPPMLFDSFEVHSAPTGRGGRALEFTGVLTGFHSDAR